MLTEFTDEIKPGSCRSVGLDCQSCTRHAADAVAALCEDLSASAIESSFHRMFPDTACFPMMPSFAKAYFEATEPDYNSLVRLTAAVA